MAFRDTGAYVNKYLRKEILDPSKCSNVPWLIDILSRKWWEQILRYNMKRNEALKEMVF